MSDEAIAGSNPAESAIPAADTTAVDTQSNAPAPSARDALVAAFAKTEPKDEPNSGVPSEPAKAAADRARDEAGRFAPKSAGTNENLTIDAKGSGAITIKPPESAKVEQPAVTPPTRFAKPAQEAWAQTPEPVRAEVERAIGELTQGIERYKAEASAFEPIRKYDEMARASGTTLDKALANYTGIEAGLRQDPIAGTMQIWRNIGIDPHAMVQALVAQVSGQPASTGVSPEIAALHGQIAEMQRRLETEVGSVKQTFEQQQLAAKQRDAQAAVDKFASDHPYFDELSDPIAQMIETGFAKDLSDAYEKAIRLNPEISAKIEADKQPPKQPDPAQTRKANLSITGTPSAGSNPTTRKPAGSTREALQGAFAQVGL